MRLFHFSEDLSIRVFSPHRAKSSALDDEYVWAIAETSAHRYYFPRDCPRACFWPTDETSDADRERWFGAVAAREIVAVESAWLDRIRSTTLYRYEMPPATFGEIDAIAGHWVSREAVEPLSVEPMGDLLGALVNAGVELRITPSLIRLWEQVVRSTLGFSGTRLRNAQGWEDGGWVLGTGS